jgi:hypothetical protein
MYLISVSFFVVQSSNLFERKQRSVIKVRVSTIKGQRGEKEREKKRKRKRKPTEWSIQQDLPDDNPFLH